MITVVVGLDPSGNLVFAEASGHAGTGKRGEDLVCAAATAILRTTMQALAAGPSGASGETSGDSRNGGPAIEATTAGRGSLSFRVTAFSGKDEPFLRYAACFLREGIASLEREYPEAVRLRIEKIGRG